MTTRGARRLMLAAVAALASAAFADSGAAQSRHENKARTPAAAAKPAPKKTTTTTNNVPNALQGFSKNQDQPIHIEADSLEIRDKDRVATFRGNVHVTQGDTDLRANDLIVYYEQSASGDTTGARALPASTGGTQNIRRLEAKGNVVVRQKDQTATGDTGVFDMRKNIITLSGNVAVSENRNVLRGDRLVVDMTTGVSHLESDRGRVQGLFVPSKRQEQGPNGDAGVIPRLH